MIALGLVSSAVFGWLAIRDLDWGATRDILGQVRWLWIVLYLASVMFLQCIRLGRWALLLHSLGETRLKRSLTVGAVGIAAIFFFPARLGEFVRPVLIAQKGRVGVGEAASTVVVERLLDGILVGLVILLIGVSIGDSLPAADQIRTGGVLVGSIFFGLGLAVTIVSRFPMPAFWVIDALFRRWPGLAEGLKNMIHQFRSGLFTLLRSKHALGYLAVTCLLWICGGLSLLLLAEALNLEIPIIAAFLILGAQQIGILVPAGPTAVGTFHIAVIWAMTLYGIAEPLAFNFAVIFHLANVLVNLGMGALGLAAGAGRR